MSNETVALQWLTLATVCLVGVGVRTESALPYGREAWTLVMLLLGIVALYGAFKSDSTESDTA